MGPTDLKRCGPAAGTAMLKADPFLPPLPPWVFCLCEGSDCLTELGERKDLFLPSERASPLQAPFVPELLLACSSGM